MSHFLRPLLQPHQEAVLVNERTGALLASVVETAFDSATRRRGLLGRDDLPAGQALVLAPCNAIHSFRMRFPIDVLFVARDGVIMKIVERLGAWRVAASFSAFATVELRAGAVAAQDLAVGDRLALRSVIDDLRTAPDIRLAAGRQVRVAEGSLPTNT
jgi:uncharacterized protein